MGYHFSEEDMNHGKKSFDWWWVWIIFLCLIMLFGCPLYD